MRDTTKEDFQKSQHQVLQWAFLHGAAPFRHVESHEPFQLYACPHPFQREKEAEGSRGVDSDLPPPKTTEVSFL